MNFIKRLLTRKPPGPSAEALRERAEVEKQRSRVDRVIAERERLLGENNYTARIRALYQEGRA